PARARRSDRGCVPCPGVAGRVRAAALAGRACEVGAEACSNMCDWPARRRALIYPSGRPMLSRSLKSLFGSHNERVTRQLNRVAARINTLEPACEKLSDEELRAKTDEFKQRYAAGESLDKLLPEAFA